MIDRFSVIKIAKSLRSHGGRGAAPTIEKQSSLRDYTTIMCSTAIYRYRSTGLPVSPRFVESESPRRFRSSLHSLAYLS